DSRPDAGSGPLANLGAECRGEIEILPESVLFHGPVAANGLLADGQEDPRGLHVVAQHLAIARAHDTGKPTRVDADGEVDVDGKDLRAHSARVGIALKATHGPAEDPAGARVEVGGRRFIANRIDANYVSYEVTYWSGRFEQDQQLLVHR